jgi:V/A-type H+-transporting ATPase subunit K
MCDNNCPKKVWRICGSIFAILGAALAALLPIIGAALASGIIGDAVVRGVAQQELASTVMLPSIIYQYLPVILGFITAWILLKKILGQNLCKMCLEKGLAYLAACLPMALGGLFAAWGQAKVMTGVAAMSVMRPELIPLCMIYPLVISLLSLLGMVMSWTLINAVSCMKICCCNSCCENNCSDK